MEGEERTDRRLYWGAVALSLLGLLVAGYLTYIKWFPSSPFCLAGGGCATVNNSIYSEVAGIPVALLGALSYVLMLVVLLLEPRVGLARDWGPLVVFGVAFAGTLYSAYLTYLEIAVIREICPYCVTSAILITLICIVSGVRVYRRWLAD